MAAKKKIGKDIVKQWFDRMEQVLQHEAELAGLFEHGVSTGTAREFLVSRVLRSFLPSFVHLGSGQIFSAGAGMSNQIDSGSSVPEIRDRSRGRDCLG
jgi:hypothetical protein